MRKSQRLRYSIFMFLFAAVLILAVCRVRTTPLDDKNMLPTLAVLATAELITLPSAEFIASTETQPTVETSLSLPAETAFPSLATAPSAAVYATAQLSLLSTVTPITSDYAALLETVRERGSVRVIASLNVNFQPAGLLSAQAAQAQQAQIDQTQQSLLSGLATYDVTLLSQSDQWALPGIALQVDEAALNYLMSSPSVVNLVQDVPLEMALDDSAAAVDAAEAWAMGYTGVGQTVVIIDSGIDAAHSTFGGRVVAEACYSWNQPDDTGTPGYNERNDSLCPGGGIEEFGAGAADLSRCEFFLIDCSHGTHVAGIAAGEDSTYRGIAPDANIIAIQVFTRWQDCPTIPGVQQCILSYTADQISALNYVYTTLRFNYNIAAINISIGSGRYFDYCDAQNPTMTNIINQLWAANITTVIASSNNAYYDSISFPACITSAVSVGSTNNNDVVSYFSNADDTLDLIAPGEGIMSALPGGIFGPKTGTSMATPHVVGAFALLRQAQPSLTAAQGLVTLQNSGVAVLDSRNHRMFCRIDLDNAIAAVLPNAAPIAPRIGCVSDLITDQELLAAIQVQPELSLRAILVVMTPTALDIYLEANSARGIVTVEIEQGNLVVAMSIASITNVNGGAAPQAFVDAVNLHLPMLLTTALNDILLARFGVVPDVTYMTLQHNALEVGVVLP
jgi:hypothetical protein